MCTCKYTCTRACVCVSIAINCSGETSSKLGRLRLVWCFCWDILLNADASNSASTQHMLRYTAISLVFAGYDSLSRNYMYLTLINQTLTRNVLSFAVLIGTITISMEAIRHVFLSFWSCTIRHRGPCTCVCPLPAPALTRYPDCSLSHIRNSQNGRFCCEMAFLPGQAHIKQRLQWCLYAKWLSISDERAAEAGMKERFVLAINKWCTEICTGLWGTAHHVLGYLYKFGFSLIFIIAQVARGPVSLACVVIYATTLLLGSATWFYFRADWAWDRRLGSGAADEVALMSCKMKILDERSAIRSVTFAAAFADHVSTVGKVEHLTSVADIWFKHKHTTWLMKALQLVAICSFWLAGPRFVDPMGMSMPLGTFLAFIASVGQISDAAIQVTSDLIVCYQHGARVEQLAALLNLDRAAVPNKSSALCEADMWL